MMNNDPSGKPHDTQFISFQDFSPINRSGGAGQAQLDLGSPDHQQFVNLTNDPIGSNNIGMMEELQGLPEQKEAMSGGETKSFWTLEYYQKYFNVNTNDVVQRIKKSMLPHGIDNYLLSHIRPNPDLYGPVWVCVTLIFAIAISGNVANYLQTADKVNHWRYEFHIVSYAATAICLYVWLLPVGLWAAMKWTSAADNNTSMDIELIETNAEPGLLELLCLYGYSLSIFIPVAFLWIIQIPWLQWLLVAVAAALSGGVLLRTLLPLIVGKQKPIYIAVILGMHLIFATGFMLYFFHASAHETVPIPTVAHITTVAPNLIPKVTNNTA